MFKANPLSFKAFRNTDDSIIDKLMSFIKAKSASGCDDFSYISLSAIICIEVKKWVKVLYLIEIESGIVGDYWFCEDDFLFCLDDGFAFNTHLDILTLI